MAEAPARQFPLVQALRAVAALSVALTHILHDALSRTPGSEPLQALYRSLPWGAGVDIFFVISGFVIVHSSSRLFATRWAGRRFAARRVARIVPLYWTMTSLLLAQAFFDRTVIHGAIGGAEYIAKSYLFIPCARPDGIIQPVLGLGWTLNYEMFFYGVFIPFLALRRSVAVFSASFLLSLFVLAGRVGWLHGVVLRTWSNPIVLEFCAGMLLALIIGKFTLRDGWRLTIVLAAAVVLLLQPAWSRIYAYGLPATGLVFAAVSGKKIRSLPRVEAWLARLGDASYAMYLIHPFIMRAGLLLWKHPGPPVAEFAYVALSLLIAQAAAIAIHYGFEKPATHRLRAVLEPKP